MSKLRRIDEENEDFLKVSIEKSETGKLKVDDILGFRLKSPKVFIPRVPCSYSSPSNSMCEDIPDESNNLIFTLTPLYDALIYPISTNYLFGEKMTIELFEKSNNIKIDDFIKFVIKGRIIPYFEAPYSDYDSNFVNVFLEPGLPRISFSHMSLLYCYNFCEMVENNCEKCREYHEKSRKEFKEYHIKPPNVLRDFYIDRISTLYRLGISKERILKLGDIENSLKYSGDIIIANNIQATIETNCTIAKESLGLFSNVEKKEGFFDTIVKGLGVNYTPEIDLENYLDIMDSNTTKAIRKITEKIRQDPFAMKYSERLNSKLVDYNRQIEEISKSKTAKLYNAVSDIVVYSAEKVIEDQTKSKVKVESSNLRKISDWVASRFMDAENLVRRRDLTLAQLYRTKYKIDECKKSK